MNFRFDPINRLFRAAVAAVVVSAAAGIANGSSPPQGAQKKAVRYVCPPCGEDCHDKTYDKPGECENQACGMTLVVQEAANPTEDADRSFTLGEWANAAKSYALVTKADPQDGRAWFRLGYSLHMDKKLDQAIVAHLKAAEFDQHRVLALYNVACVHALKGRTDKAFAALGKALEAGFNRADTLSSDGDLDSIREDPRFVKITAKLNAGRRQSDDSRRNVAILVHEGVELLDFAGPGEVFASGNAFNVYTVASSTAPIISQRFLTIVPEYTFANCPKPDIIVLPGGQTTVALNDKKVMSWVAEASPDAEITLSVCTGAMILAKAGLLDGLQATTHWGAIERLRMVAPKTKVLENRRFVDNGKIITSAGVSAGIDAALHIVSRLLGEDAARRRARGMEYPWSPTGTENQDD